MNKKKYIDIKFVNATKWQSQDHLSSGGTRAKRVLENSLGKQFFFKESERKAAKDNKPAKYYQYEFFNEIIAYQLGKQMGLDVLRYDIAVFNNTIGCISPSMHNIDKEEQLVEFGKYMIALNPNFDPNTYETRNEYSFQLLENAFRIFKLNEKYMKFIFKVLLFDSIIGNVDRHQENWAFITKPSEKQTMINEIINQSKSKNVLVKFKRLFKNKKFEEKIIQNQELIKLYLNEIKTTAPIYDSGSSLARELTNEKIDVLLNNEETLKKYILQGKAELHWHHEKKNHFDLIDCILDTDWKLELKYEAEFIYKYKDGIIEKIINKINKKLPLDWEHYKIPENRKNLIAKIVSLRIQELKKRLSARI